MKTENITDLIEITAFNAIQIRDIVRVTTESGRVIRKPPHRHVIDGECINEHPLAHALRDVLPAAEHADGAPVHPYCDFAALVGEQEITLPDFIRVQVRSGFVRVDDTDYIVLDGDIIASERMPARTIFPGDNVSKEHKKTRLVCGVAFNVDNVNTYYTEFIEKSDGRVGAAFGTVEALAVQLEADPDSQELQDKLATARAVLAQAEQARADLDKRHKAALKRVA